MALAIRPTQEITINIIICGPLVDGSMKFNGSFSLESIARQVSGAVLESNPLLPHLWR